MYKSGVEEFLSLVKYAECIVTNSFHGIIMSVMFNKVFYGFSREQCDNKTLELTELMGLRNRMLVTGQEECSDYIGFDNVHAILDVARNESLAFLKAELELFTKNS